jgi:hypothetical protein
MVIAIIRLLFARGGRAAVWTCLERKAAGADLI